MRARLIPISLAMAMIAARAAELSGDCKLVFAAMEKSLQANHTTTSTHGTSTTHGVTVDGVTYLQIGGNWRKSPMTVPQQIAMSRNNLKDAKSFSCKAMPDAVVDGVAVTVFATHTVTDDDSVDTSIAIAKGTGLAVSVENRHAGEPGSNLVTHYGYTGVKAPM